jgi:hypothetical protein
MMLFGRSKHHLECMTADFLPFDQQLHIVVADADMNLQVMQFDPDRKSVPSHHPLAHANKLTIRSKINGRNPPPPKVHLPHRSFSFNNAPRPILLTHARRF